MGICWFNWKLSHSELFITQQGAHLTQIRNSKGFMYVLLKKKSDNVLVQSLTDFTMKDIKFLLSQILFVVTNFLRWMQKNLSIFYTDLLFQTYITLSSFFLMMCFKANKLNKEIRISIIVQ